MDTKFKEDLSIAYLRAICAKAEVTFNLQKRDEDGSDVDLNKCVSTDMGQRVISTIKVQLKSTSSKMFYREERKTITYKAKAKCYNDLIENRIVPLYLFLLILPENEEESVNFSVEQLIIKRCMYWVKLQKSKERAEKPFVDIIIEKSNVVSPEALLNILKSEGNEL